jgi:choline dehydrogenase-like flavoprotein
MFVDARCLDDGLNIQTEVCVIGGGVAGITLVLEFEKCGIQACLIESGGYAGNEATRDLYRGESIGLPYLFADGCRSRYLGGSSNCWGGWCRPLEEEDFLKREWVPYSGWPFTKAELQPYYERSHDILGLGPTRFDSGFWVDMIRHPDVRRHPFTGSGVVDVISQLSPPVRLGKLRRAQLAGSKHVTVYLNANAVDIETDSQQTVRRVKLKTLSGRKASVYARIFVLAAGGIENARLLLASNNDRQNGLGNHNDLVGRFFMDHPRLRSSTIHLREAWSRNMLYDVKYHNHNNSVAARGTCISAHFGLSPGLRAKEGLLNANVSLTSIFHGEDSEARDTLVRLNRKFKGTDQSGRPVLDELLTLARNPLDTAGFITARILRLRSLIRSTQFQVIVEPAPDPDSRVALSEERDQLGMNRAMVDWRLNTQVKRTIDRTTSLVAEEMKNAGVADVSLDPPIEGGDWPSTFEKEGCWHHMGTTRMHDSPKLGVVDRNCRVHETNNLYIAGSSVFPTAGRNFPTITIVALTLRLAEHIARIRSAVPTGFEVENALVGSRGDSFGMRRRIDSDALHLGPVDRLGDCVPRKST